MKLAITEGETIWEDGAVIVRLIKAEDHSAEIEIRAKRQSSSHPSIPPLPEVEILPSNDT